MAGETIAAIATPLGVGAVGMVRLSGREASSVAGKLFKPQPWGSLREAPPRRPHRGRIIDPADGAAVDEVLLTFFPAPASYTGEDVVEISGHGGPLVVSRILRLVLGHGARLAEPGEFTRRAFLNGKLDLAQAEAVLDVIRAQTDAAHRAAVSHLIGAFSREVGSVREELLRVLARLEVSMDFPEEDAAEPTAGELAEDLEPIRSAILRKAESYHRGRLLRAGIAVVLVGRPNVGKSSLLNALLEAPRAIVTSEPGTTRDLIEEPASIGGLPVRLVDTAGLREVVGEAEAEGVRRAQEMMAQADCLLLVVDTSKPLVEEDKLVLAEVAGRFREGCSVIACLNKADLPAAVSPEELEALVGSEGSLSVSARTGEGVEALRGRIGELILGGEAVPTDEALVTRERHLQALREAADAVSRALEAVSLGRPMELVAADLKGACEALGKITGATYTEDLLDAVFREFCLGK
jgi:tRNA modification GTPase